MSQGNHVTVFATKLARWMDFGKGFHSLEAYKYDTVQGQDILHQTTESQILYVTNTEEVSVEETYC